MTSPPQYPTRPEDDFTGPPQYPGQGGYAGYAGGPPYDAAPPYAGGPPHPGGYGPPPQSNGLAIAGLVLGIVSVALFILTWIDTIVGVLAVIFSAIALSRARRQGRRVMALWGLVLGIVGIVVSIAALAVIVWFGNRVEQRCEDHLGHPPSRAELRQCVTDGV